MLVAPPIEGAGNAHERRWIDELDGSEIEPHRARRRGQEID
jgi:hypothetical protein